MSIFRLVGLVKIKKGLDVVTMRKSAFPFFLRQAFARLIPPAALAHERVPDEDFLVVWSPALLKTPFQNFGVRASPQGAFGDLGVLHVEKARAPAVHARPEIIAGGQFSLHIQAHLVQQPSKEDDAADLFVGTA